MPAFKTNTAAKKYKVNMSVGRKLDGSTVTAAKVDKNERYNQTEQAVSMTTRSMAILEALMAGEAYPDDTTHSDDDDKAVDPSFDLEKGDGKIGKEYQYGMTEESPKKKTKRRGKKASAKKDPKILVEKMSKQEP